MNTVFATFEGDLYELCDELHETCDRMRYYKEVVNLKQMEDLRDSLKCIQDDYHTQEYLDEENSKSWEEGKTRAMEVLQRKIEKIVDEKIKAVDLVKALNGLLGDLKAGEL